MFEIGRRLVDGIWKTGPSDESAGGSSLPTAWDVSEDGSLDMTLAFGEHFAVTTNGGNSNEVYFKDNLGAPVVDITDSSVSMGGSSYISPSIAVNDLGAAVFVPPGKSFEVYTGTTSRIVEAAVSGGGARQLGFYGATPVAQQTGVAVSAAAIHAALVNLGLITA